MSIRLPALADSWIVTRQKSRDNSLGLTFPETDHVCSRPRCLAPITNCRFGADRLARAGAGDTRRRNRHHRRSHLRQPGAGRGWTVAVRSARQVRRDLRLRLRPCRRSEVVDTDGHRLSGHVLYFARPRLQRHRHERLSRADQQALHHLQAARRPDGRSGRGAPNERRSNADRHHPAHGCGRTVAHRARSRWHPPRGEWFAGFAAGVERPRQHRCGIVGVVARRRLLHRRRIRPLRLSLRADRPPAGGDQAARGLHPQAQGQGALLAPTIPVRARTRRSRPTRTPAARTTRVSKG